jgi:hypothetical protein
MVAVVDMDFSNGLYNLGRSFAHDTSGNFFGPSKLRRNRFTVDLFQSSLSPVDFPHGFFPHVLTDTTAVMAKRYSMIFALKAYIGERSFRDQFKARHAINDCKARPRAAAEARWIGYLMGIQRLLFCVIRNSGIERGSNRL